MSIFNANPLRTKSSHDNINNVFNFSPNEEMSRSYQYGSPYPHIVIDNFVKDTNLVDTVIDEYNWYNSWGYDPTSYSQQHQVNKFFSPWCIENIKDLPPTTKKVIDHFNSRPMLTALEKLTGIDNLIPDFNLEGSGMHKISKGGKLSVHVDYNKHPSKPMYRRINLLLYLNKDWNESWGGHLQLWNSDVTKLEKAILPIYNRLVIFNTTPISYHGHPHPLECPENRHRYSIAMYYFTKDRPDSEKDGNTTAIWKEIPN